MIIFTPIKQIPVELLTQKGIRQVVAFNLSSYFNDYPTLNLLVPSPQFISEDLLNGDCTTPEFDMSYHNFILNNDEAFLQFMNIMIPVFSNPDVLVQILINVSNFRDVITESLIKFIQQRYGYNSYLVYNLDDFVCVEESDMSVPGLFAMDQDLQRWQMMIGSESNLYQEE